MALDLSLRPSECSRLGLVPKCAGSFSLPLSIYLFATVSLSYCLSPSLGSTPSTAEPMGNIAAKEVSAYATESWDSESWDRRTLAITAHNKIMPLRLGVLVRDRDTVDPYVLFVHMSIYQNPLD